MSFIIPHGKGDIIFVPPPLVQSYYTFDELEVKLNEVSGTNSKKLNKISFPGSMVLFYINSNDKKENQRMSDILGYKFYGNAMVVHMGMLEPKLCMKPDCFNKTQHICNKCFRGTYCSNACMINDNHDSRCIILDNISTARIQKLNQCLHI